MEDEFSKAVLIYGGIKFSQKFLPINDNLDAELKEKALKLLNEQEKIIERVLNMNFKNTDEKEEISYKIFKLCQKDVYSIM